MTDRKNQECQDPLLSHIEYVDSDGNHCVVDIERDEDDTPWVSYACYDWLSAGGNSCKRHFGVALEHTAASEIFANLVLAERQRNK